jgi:hypothetical protein
MFSRNGSNRCGRLIGTFAQLKLLPTLLSFQSLKKPLKLQQTEQNTDWKNSTQAGFVLLEHHTDAHTPEEIRKSTAQNFFVEMLLWKDCGA